jgi:putative transposase
MHFLITNYTVFINKKHKRHGHLFQGRFRSILIEAVSYAKELSRYIHLNPVRSGLADRPEQYAWSSYGRYRGTAKPERWLETSVVLRLFGEQSEESKKAYIEFVMRGIGEEAPASIKESVRKGILGSEEFIARIRKEYLGDECIKPDREKPQLRKLLKKPDLSKILSESEKVLGPRNKFLVPIAIFISHRNAAFKLREIGGFYSLSISGVANACNRARAAMADNAVLARAVQEIEHEVVEAENETA